MDRKTWPNRLGDKITRLGPTLLFFWGFVGDRVYGTFVPKLLQRERPDSTAIKIVSQEELDIARLNLENGLHATIQKAGGDKEHQ